MATQPTHPASKPEHKEVQVSTPEGPHPDVKKEEKSQISENTRLEQEAGKGAVKLAEARLKAEQEAGRAAVEAASGSKKE